MELLNSIRAEGLGAILGTEHEGLRKRFLHSPSQRWLDETCAKYGVKSEPRSNLAHLIDAWMVASMKDAEFFDLVLPVLRKQPAAGIDLLSDDEALAVWRSAFTPVIEYAASISSAPVPVDLARAVTRKTTTTVQSVREILKAHYGASVIAALERHDKLSIYADAGELPQSVQQRYSMSALDKVVGVTVDGNVGLVANMLTPVMVPGVFLHEAGEHAALSNMLGRDYGRVVREFNRLLRADDTYAKQAAMRVPAGTPARHVPSERLAYMVESVANDRQARRGGAGGYRLGQQCLSSLRTWLFRTPTFRWLESAGELEHFTLSPQDIAGLAREAVNHFANTVEPDVAGELNKWRNTLAEDDLLALSKMEASPRHDALAAMADERLVGYLYSLVVLGVPGIEDSVELFTERLAELAAGKETDSEQPIQDVAAAVLLEAGLLRNRAAIANQVEEVGYSVWVDGTSSPVQATVSVLEKSHANGGYRVASSTVGSGAIQERVFVSLGDAVSAATASSFVASTLEAPDMMRKWADYEHSIGERLGSRAFDEWFDKSQVVDEATGEPLVLYHGTASDFEKFDAAKHRTVLNDKYQGDGFHFTASPSVASTYADANRNNSFNKAAIFASVEREYPGRIADVFKAVVNLGYSRAWEMSDEEIRATLDEAATAGVDLNDLLDLARCVEGTRYHAGRQDHGGFELFELFNGGSGEGLIGDQDRDSAVTLGLEDALPNPLVMPVFLSAKNVLRTDDRDAAKAAQSNGYDGVYYSGPDTVAGEPEWVVFSPDQIKSAIGFTGKPVPAIGSIRQRESLTPQLAFNQWFDGSVIVDKSGEPLVVYHGTEADFTAFADGPAFFSPRWDYSYIRNASFVMPVYLSIKKPYRPSNQSEIEQIRSNPDRLAELKAEGYDGMIWAKQGDLMRGPSGWGNDLPQIVTFYPEQVKSATGNRGAFDAQDADIRFTFAGALAKSAIHADLEQAKQLADAGAEAEAIQVQTGWHAGVDGKWRFEIDDSQASLVDGWEVVRGDAGEVDGAQVFKMIGNLGDELVQLHPIMAEKLGITESISHGILEHPALFRAYPELASISVELRKCDGYPFAARGYFNTAARRIYLEINESRGGSVIGALIHEIQHAVQSVEGFARGGSPDEFRAEITRPRKLEELKAKITALEEANPELAKIKRQMRRQYIRLENKYGTNDTLTDWDSVPESEREEYFALVSTAQSFDEFFALADLEDEINRLFSQENSDQSASEQYRRLAGEIEARNSESRFNLTSEQRRSNLATKTADRKAEEAIVVWDGVVMALDGELVEGLIKTDTQSFKNWFDGSKAVDANAEPMVLYHGTRGDFSSFDALRTGSASDAGWFGSGFYLSPNADEAEKYAQGEGGNVMPVYAALKNPYDWRAENERGLFQNNPAHSGEKTKELIEAGHDGVFVYEDSFGLMPGQSLTDEQWSVLIKSGPKLLRVIGRESINQRFREKAYSYQSIVEAYGKEVAAVLPRIRTLKEVVVFRPEQIKSVMNKGTFDPKNPDIRFRESVNQFGLVNWFRDSKIVNPDGTPKVMYHKTFADFTVFDSERVGENDYGYAGAGFYFMPVPMQGFTYGDRTMPVYLSIQNPYVRTATSWNTDPLDPYQWIPANSEKFGGDKKAASRAWTAMMRAQGYDGFIDNATTNGEVVAFDNTQIKSAIGNNGLFDASNPDIRFSAAQKQLGFDSWFSDSKVVDANGKPLMVYHGTGASFGKFEASRGNGHYFTDDKDAASAFAENADGDEYAEDEAGSNVVPVYLSINNPLILDSKWQAESMTDEDGEWDWGILDNALYDAEVEGHDGAILRGFMDFAGLVDGKRTERQYDQYIAFRPEQIKSAIGNNGGFDPTNPDIRFSTAPQKPDLDSWFADSQVVGDDGKPRVVYHGTNADFDEFVLPGKKTGKMTGGRAIFFSESPETANYFARYEGGRVIPAFIRLVKPFDFRDESHIAEFEPYLRENFDAIAPGALYGPDAALILVKGGDYGLLEQPKVISWMKRKGFDGIRLVERPGADTYAVFRPDQIRFAIGGSGLSEASKPDIRFRAADLANQTESEQFKAWFGDWRDPKAFSSRAAGPVSYAVSDTGAPLVLYHATNADFNVFEPGRSTVNSTTFGDMETERHGIFASPSASFSEEYLRAGDGQNLMPIFMSIKSPLDMREGISGDAINDIVQYSDAEIVARDFYHVGTAETWQFFDGDFGRKFVAAAQKAGYDGAILTEASTTNPDASHEVYVAFSPAQIKSALGNNGDFNPSNPDIRFSFAGAGAETANRTSLEQAKLWQEQGEPSEFIRRETGWFLGADSKWRFEIDDSNAVAKENWSLWGQNKTAVEFKLADLIEHWALFDAYPHMRSVAVLVTPEIGAGGAIFHGGPGITPSISLFAEKQQGQVRLSAEQLSVIQHELQHVIQQYEGFASGGSPADVRPTSFPQDAIDQLALMRSEYDALSASAFELRSSLSDLMWDVRKQAAKAVYLSLAGEVEARNVQARLAMTRDERIATSPLSTQDTDIADQVIIWNGQMMHREPVADADSEAADLGALAQFLSQDDDYQFYNFQEREDIYDRLIARRMADEQFAGMALPASFGSVLITRSAKQEGAWQVTSFDAKGQPSSDDGIQSKEQALRTFFEYANPSLADQQLVEIASASVKAGKGFDNWFGASKVVRPDGSPQVVYHGTSADFDVFHVDHKGVFFTANPDVARPYSMMRSGTPNTIPAFLSIQNPWTLIQYADDVPYIHQVDQTPTALKAQGYDGILCPNESGRGDVWIAFEASQIKSAIGNNGDFDPSNPDIRFRESIADDVMERAALVSAAENEEAAAKSLDMSHAARIERAKAMGFDTETVWYHGTEGAGFAAFDAKGKRGTKTEGTGAFFTSSRAVAAPYTPSNKDAPVFTGQELFNDPDLADGSVDVESAWVFMDSRGRVTETWDAKAFDSADQILAAEEFELEDGESLEKRYTVWVDGNDQGKWVSEAEAIEQLNEVELNTPGIYAVYLRTKDVLEIDWEGRNWQDGPEETVWNAVDDDGDVVDTCFSADELDDFKAQYADCSFDQVQQSTYFSTDDAATQARQMGFDAVLIKNVEDNGSHGQGSIDGSVMVVFDASNIRLTSAAFDPAFTASADIRLRQADAESRTDVRLGDALVMRDAFKDWFAGSPVVDAAGAPQVMYHGTKKGGDLTSFQPGGTDYETRSGDAYGVASYFTSDPDEASRYAGDAGAVIPVYITGNILDLDHELSAAHAAQLTAFANRVILPSDRARFGMSQRTEKFANTSQARSFYEAKMEEWKALGDRMDRAKPEADKDGDQLVVRYIDFTSPIEIKSGQDAKVLFGAIGWDNVRPAGFDGVLMTRDGGAQWAVMHNPAGTVKSVFNLGSFNRGTPDIRFSTTEPVGALAVLRDGTPVPESGKPVAYYYGKNLAKAPAMGALYMQDIEPAGDYMVVSPIAMNAVNPVEGWEYGTIEFKSPLVIDAAGALVEWKKKLSDQYQGKTGPALSKALRKDGYDSIITYDSYGLTETISLGPQRKPGGSLGLTDLPAFKAWFDGSKVAQADGSPKVVYHGARPSEDAEAITEFDRLFMVKERGRRVSQDNVGLWFTENNGARGVDLYSGGDRVHGGVVYPVYLSIKHPWEVSFSGMKRTANRLLGRERDTKMDEEAVEAVRAWMIENERDGVRLVHDPRDGDEFAHQQVWVALEPEQIKSAIGNSGEFGQSNPDIRFSMDSSSAVPESTRDASFKKWFGLSKAVGKNGEPLVMYHGTLSDFTEFTKDSIQSRHSYSFGFHFTNRPGEASAYTDHSANRANGFDPNHPNAVPPMEGGNVMPVYLRAEKPLEIVTKTQSASMVADLDKWSIISQLLVAKRAGNPFDSVIIRSEGSEDWRGINVIVFDPTQIKSAIGNSGDFDPTNPDIRFSMAEEALPDHPFKGFTRAQFLGAPKITSDSNAADLRPSSGNSLIDVVPEPFVSVRGGLTAKYSKMAGAVFDGNKVIASYSFGDTLVVDKKYRREGIGAELVYQWRMRFPESKTAETRTKKSQALMEKVWSRVATEVSASEHTAASNFNDSDHDYQRGFGDWFADSKVVDDDGKPRVVYHGTGADFDIFDSSMIGQNFDQSTLGFYFTNAPKPDLLGGFGYGSTASEYAVNAPGSPNVMPVYLSLQNPLVLDDAEEWGGGVSAIDKQASDIARWAKDHGYDGVIAKDGTGENSEVIYVAFRPEQIKSAIGNNGNFDPANPDIRFSVAAEEVALASDQMARPKTMYRSVSPHEWEQIKADGVIRGGLNAFNPWDSRREVFFGDALSDQLIAQGEDIIRRAEYMVQSSPINAAFKNKQSELLSIGSLIANAASKLGFASREDMPGFMFNSNKTLKGLRQREKVVEVEIDALRESARAQINATAAELRREDAERGYSSVVIETRPLTGGRVYSGQSSGMGNEPEYGFQSGSVLLEDVVSIRFVSGRKVLSSQVWRDGKPNDPDIRFRIADEEIQTAKVGTRAFEQWFSSSVTRDSQGNPEVMYHGTVDDFTEFNSDYIWASAMPALANDYAEMRSETTQKPASVMPVFLRAVAPFDADKAKHLNRMSSFFREMEAQARGAGREFDQELVASLLATVLAEARKEESGPYYNVQDIWNASSMRFGQTGAEAIKQAFNVLGFDSIKFTEHGQTTVGVLEPWQVKSALGNAGFFDAASADIRCSLAKTEGQAGFNLWNEGNYAVDGEGRPLLVFRGEHGVAESVFQSRIGSLSFGSLETAVHYALNPNDRREQVREPRLIPAYLTIKNPVMVDANDPFIDLSLIAAAVGHEKARQIAVDLEQLILRTSYFEGVKCDSLDSYLTDHPSALGDLYVDAFHVFDSHEYVEWFRQAGFDGAVHCGAGASMQTAEYKVFSPEQVIAATPIAVPSTQMSPRYVEAFCDVVRQLAPVVDVGHVGGSLNLSGAADSQFVLSMASGDSEAPRETHSITPICAAIGLRSM